MIKKRVDIYYIDNFNILLLKIIQCSNYIIIIWVVMCSFSSSKNK